jgi:drug/metabolite transporter (DMT)-like permease
MLYSPAIDITAIYATSAFWAYFFSMILLKQPLSRVTVGSIGLAFSGVVVLSLDGIGEAGEGEGKGEGGGRGRAFGDLVMMFGEYIQLLLALQVKWYDV